MTCIPCNSGVLLLFNVCTYTYIRTNSRTIHTYVPKIPATRIPLTPDRKHLDPRKFKGVKRQPKKNHNSRLEPPTVVPAKPFSRSSSFQHYYHSRSPFHSKSSSIGPALGSSEEFVPESSGFSLPCFQHDIDTHDPHLHNDPGRFCHYDVPRRSGINCFLQPRSSSE